jgi:hypothetical protein
MSSNAVTPTLVVEPPQLVQDFILTQNIQLKQITANSIAMFTNAAGLTEALAVTIDDPSGALVHIYRDSTSTSGFSTTVVATGVTEVVAANVVTASFTGVVAYFRGTVPSDSQPVLQATWNGSGTWSSPVTVNLTGLGTVPLPINSGLTAATSSDQSLMWVAGSDISDQLVVVTADPGNSAGTLAIYSSITVSAPMVISGTDSAQTIFSTSGGDLLSLTVGDSVWLTSSGPFSVSAFLGTSILSGTPVSLVADTSSNLYVVQVEPTLPDPSTSFTAVGIQVSSFVATTNSAGEVRLYVVDPNGTLWLAAPNSDGAYTAVPIATGMTVVAACAGSDDVFAADTTPNVWYFSQDTTDDANWTAHLLQESAGMTDTPDEVAQYWSVVLAQDQNNAPIPNQAVTITADGPMTIVVNATAYPLATDTPVSVTTNGYGILRISTIALGVSTPGLTLAANGATGNTPLFLSSAIGAFLSGTGQLTVPGTMGATTLTGSVLLAATNSSGAALTNLQTSDEADSIATAINQIMLAQTTATISATDAAGFASKRIPRWSLTNLSTSPKFNVLAADDPLLRAEFFSLGGFITGLAGSVWQGIKTGALTMENLAVDAENKIVTLTLTVVNDAESALNGAIQFGFDEISDFGKLVESVFSMLEADIDEVITWLRLIFDWAAIENTQTAVMTLLNQTIALIPAFTADAATTVSTWLTNEQANIASGIWQWLGTNSSFASVQPNGQGSVTSSISLPSMTNLPGHWLLDKIESHLDFITITTANDPNAPSLTAALTTAIQTIITSAQSAFQSFATTLQSSDSFRDVVIDDVLAAANAVVTVIIGVAEAFVNAIQAFVDAGVDVIDDALGATINVPIVSLLPVQAVTVGQLAALFIAVPATVAYEVATGSEPFPGGTLPSSLPTNSTSSNTTDFAADTAGITTDEIYAIFSIPYLLVSTANDLIVTGRAQSNETAKSAMGFAAVLNTVALLATSFPGTPLLSGDTAFEGASWLAGVAGPTFDMVAMCYDLDANIQLGVDSLIGGISLVLAAVAAGTSSTITYYGAASSIVGAVPPSTSFLLSAAVSGDTDDLIPAAKVITDAVCITTSALCALSS